MKRPGRFLLVSAAPLWVLLATAAVSIPTAWAGDEYAPKMTRCTMSFNIKGWSFVFKTSKGEGKITCENGQAADVKLRSMGGGFTLGKSQIIGGKAKFSRVRNISELFGTYAEATGHAGANVSGGASVLTKGEVSMVLSGSGSGVDIGVSLGGFRIEPR